MAILLVSCDFVHLKITGDKQYAVDGYMTLRSMFRQFGHGFYAIGIPVHFINTGKVIMN